MPVILKTENENGQRTGIWEIKENEETLLEKAFLNNADFHTFSQLTNPGRRLEWLAVRVLLKEFYPTTPSIDYHKTGKPLLINNSDKISISHSGKMVAIALSEGLPLGHSSHNPGIDIEIIHPRIFKIASRFLNEVEKGYSGSHPSVEQLLVIWGAKEVLFKVYEHGGVSFKDNFNVQPFTFSEKGILKGVINTSGNNLAIPMEYRKIGDYIMVQTDYRQGDFEKKP